jgi:phosphate transport system substrate-binding protein
MATIRTALVASALAAVNALSQEKDTPARLLPAYQPERQVTGVIRTWGHGGGQNDILGKLVKSWEAGFRKHQPGVEFETSLRGNASAIGGLYTKAADIAILGREIWPIEIDAFQQVFERKPYEVPVMTGGLDVRDHGFALVIFVHKDNPLAKLTLAQLDGIFGIDHRRGPRNFRTWGELGLTNEWADKPIHLYGFGIVRDSSYFFEQTVLGGSRRWNCDLREFADGQQIVDALAKDRSGIGVSGRAFRNANVKPIALASQDRGPYYEATKETVMHRRYPLTRTISLFIDRAAGQPIDGKLKEYLRYVLSHDGQEAVARDSCYLPLNPDAVEQQRRRIE